MCKPHKKGGTGKKNADRKVFARGFGKIRALQSASADLREALR